MTAQYELDRTLGAWFDAEAAPAPPPEPLARILELTRAQRPRPSSVAGIGSHWVGGRPEGSIRGGIAGLRPAMVIALVALLVLALAAAALLVGSRLLAPKLLPPHTYELVGAADLGTPMWKPVVAPLRDGRVLVVGRVGDYQSYQSGIWTETALIYDPATGASFPTGPILSPDRSVTTAVQLSDARVLILGNAPGQIFDPATLQFVEIGASVTPRFGGELAVLADGRVLIAGGQPPFVEGNVGRPLTSAELFDPKSRTFSSTGSMGAINLVGPMAVLPDGRVFVASQPTAEVYDPADGTFTAAGTPPDITSDATFAVAIPDGRVVVIGISWLRRESIAAIWNPESRSFSLLSDHLDPVWGATMLDDGRVLMWTAGPIVPFKVGKSASLQILDPTTGMTTPAETIRSWDPTLTRLGDGRVLIVGGLSEGSVNGAQSGPQVSTVEIFQ